MKRAMKESWEEPEDAMERVLSGLREVEAAPGLERRVMEALERRAADALPVRVGVLRFGWRGQPVAWVAIAAALMLIAGGALSLRRFGGHARGSVRLQADVRLESAAGPGLELRPPDPGRESARRAEGSAARAAKTFATVRPVHMARGVRASVLRTDGEGHAQEAVSFPAPPLPLTEQERLLLRVVHRGDREEIAMLDPAVRLAEARRERAEFKEFFQPVAATMADPVAEAQAADAALLDSAMAAAAPAMNQAERSDRNAAGPAAVGQKAGAKHTVMKRRR